MSNTSTCTASSVYEEYNSCAAYGGGRDEDYWVKDNADIDRLVEDVMTQTDYPDPDTVRDALIECNFDMAATVEYVLQISMSIVMSHNVEESGSSTTDHNVSIDQPASTTSEISLNQTKIFSPKKQVTDMDEQCEDVGESEESNSSN